MKKYIHTIVASTMLLSFVGTSFATESQEDFTESPRVYSQTLASTVLSSTYAEITSFSEGLAVVTTYDGKIGVIDGYGNEVLAPSARYHSIGSFQDGFAVFYTYDMYDEGNDANDWTPATGYAGYLNAYGQEVYCVESEGGRGSIILGDFANGYGFIYDAWMLFSESGSFQGAGEGNFLMDIYGNVNPVTYPGANDQWRFYGQVDESGLLAFHSDDYDYDFDAYLWGFQRVDGSVVLEPQFYNFSGSGFVDGLCAVQNSYGLWGYVDGSGNMVIPYQFESFWDFAEGYVAYRDVNGQVGFMDTSGNVVIAPQFYGTYGFEDGFAWVTSENGAGLINKAGELVVPYQYDSMSAIVNGYATVGYGEWIDGEFYGQRGLMDTAGNIVVPIQYDSVKYTGDSNKVLVELDGVFTIMDFGSSEPLTYLSGASDWAVPYIEEVYQAGLLEGMESLWGNYNSNINREQFCSIMVNFYQKIGRSVNTEDNPFVDTSNPSVIGAYNLGIVGGKSATEFYPYAPILRQELALMMYRVCSLMGETSVSSQTLSFHDSYLVMDWAMEAMIFAVEQGYLAGDNGYITPSDNLTSEQAVVVVRNLLQNYS